MKLSVVLGSMFQLTVACAKAQECNNDGTNTCKTADDCMSPSEFQKLVSSYYQDESVLPSLRGTIDNVISTEDTIELINSLPNFVEASGYDATTNGRAYSSPQGYAALGLKELQSYPQAYDKLMNIRELVRLATEKSLNLCPGSLHIDFTTISQKVEGGAHRAHADNCIHYFEDGVAVCDTSRDHPYPKRVAASILYLNDPITGHFNNGQFYFANRTNHGKVEVGGVVDISAGKMVYFTSGVENLHGALPVQSSENFEPRRIALAMWYVFDKSLMESVEQTEDADAPAGIFTLSLPSDLNRVNLLQSMGTFLVLKQNKPAVGSWKLSMYGDSTLHILFKDHTAMLSIRFAEKSIVVGRHTDTNKRPSLQYMLQESVMLHSVLDEFTRLITEKQLNEHERTSFNREIDGARSKLPARQA